jgi:hypothetical protein
MSTGQSKLSFLGDAENLIMISSNSACESLENVTTTIATKDLAWRLYHSEKIVSQLQATEDAIALATRTFGVRSVIYLLLITFCLDFRLILFFHLSLSA